MKKIKCPSCGSTKLERKELKPKLYYNKNYSYLKTIYMCKKCSFETEGDYKELNTTHKRAAECGSNVNLYRRVEYLEKAVIALIQEKYKDFNSGK